MNIISERLPSAGFVAIIATVLGTMAFFAWGLASPPLDRVWEIHHQMKIGEMNRLHGKDRRLLVREMSEHPDLARDLLDNHSIGIISANIDGWLHVPGATLLRTPKSSPVKFLIIDVQAPVDLLPVTLVLGGDSWREERRVTGHGALVVPIPPPGDGPEIIELKVQGKGLEADPSVLGLRVTWGPDP